MTRRPPTSLESAVAPGVRVEHLEPLPARIAKNRRRFGGFMLLFSGAIAAGVALLVAIAYPVVVLLFIRYGSPEMLVATTTDDLGRVFWLVIGIGFAVAFVTTATISFSRLIGVELRLIDRLGARVPKGGTLLDTKSVLRDMAIAGGLPRTPQLYVIDCATVNAFVLGRSYDSARIGVTQGFLERVPVAEQRAVFANLVARILALDILWATAVCAVMGPIWRLRDHDLRRDSLGELSEDMQPRSVARYNDDIAVAALFLPVYGVAVFLTELLTWYHQEAAWTAAEKADAEGMMLLKDPRSMLSALITVLDRNNTVPAAGEAYSQLFYCWAGSGFAPEDDPEMRRVARLREVLGAEGATYVPRPNVPDWPTAPRAPRIELAEQIGGDHE